MLSKNIRVAFTLILKYPEAQRTGIILWSLVTMAWEGFDYHMVETLVSETETLEDKYKSSILGDG
jgi:hypothetical protein